jgi:hypothetical protein
MVDRRKAFICIFNFLGNGDGISSSLVVVRDRLLLDKLGLGKRMWQLVTEESPAQTDGHSCRSFNLWWENAIVQKGCIKVSCPPDDWRVLIKAMLLVILEARLKT